jgi:hypothetical protein
MDEKELERLMAGIAEKNGTAINDAVTKAVEKATSGLMKSDELAAKLESLGIKSDAIKTLTEAVEKQGTEMRKLITGQKNQEGKDVGELVAEKGEEIKKMVDANQGQTFKMKINKTLLQRSAVTSNTMGYRLPGIGQLPTRGLVMANLFQNVSLSDNDVRDSNGVIRYLDQQAVTRNAAPVAEAATKPEAAITWIERTIPLETIANTIPVTKQAYRNLGFVAGEIDRLLRKNLEITVDTQLYSGDGVTPNLKGLLTSAPAVVLASLPQYQAVEGANLYDLIASLKVYVSNGSAGTGKQSKYMPNIVLMNPADILKYKLLKAVDGHYLLPPFISADGTSIDGMRVVESSVVTANTLVVGDFTYGTIYHAEDVVVEMGYVNDQFIKNQWTIRAEQVMALLIRVVDEDAFVKVADINAAVAALETV